VHGVPERRGIRELQSNHWLFGRRIAIAVPLSTPAPQGAGVERGTGVDDEPAGHTVRS
jgi:hypothetical protein